MTSTTKKGALALGGAVALASAAFAIGSQAGGGNAVAGSVGSSSTADASAPAFRQVHLGGPGGPGPRGAFLDDLAQKLGVSEEELRTALEDIRPDRPDRDEHVAELAKLLGVSEAKVREAFDKLHTAGPRAAAAGPPDSLVEGVAKDLGVSEAKARAALEKHWPQGVRFRGPGPGPRGGAPADLAKALGVSEDKLTDAFTKLRDQKRAEFAKALAAKLSISSEKVQEALRDFPHPGLRGPR